MNDSRINFSADSTFLVTGGAGFIGSNLCDKLISMGYKVRCLDNLSTGSKDNIKHLLNNPNFEFFIGDIIDYQCCLMATDKIDYVMHQAAWGSVPRSILMPLAYNDINIKGTLNLLEASKVNKVKKFVYASSSSVYGDHISLPKVEGTEGNLLSPYALTKYVVEKFAKLYSDLYNLDTYGLRYFNVFGRRQNPDGQYAAVIPKFISKILNDEQVEIYGDGLQSRDFTYIDNVVQANILACLAPSSISGNVFNIACGERKTLLQIHEEINNILQKHLEPKFRNERAGDVKHSLADISKAKELLGFFPTHSFNQGIRDSIDWYLSNTINENTKINL